NGMIYVRGQPEDFDHWGQLGNRGWGWDGVLPYFKRAESWQEGADDFHGNEGPLLTSRTADKPPLCQKMIEAGQEIGLEYREEILAGGAIGSPHILQLSGVGDPAHLARAGIPVTHALPGVGKNLQDHFIVRVVAAISGMKTLNERSRGLPFAGEVLRYLLTGTGMLTYAASLVAVSAKVLGESAT